MSRNPAKKEPPPLLIPTTHHTAKLHPKDERRLQRERQRAQGGKR